MDATSSSEYSKAVLSVLIVGCDPATRYCVERTAVRRGFVVESCASVDEARAVGAVRSLDAVFVDADRLSASLRGDGDVAAALRSFRRLVVICGSHRINELANARVFSMLARPFSVAQVDRLFDRIGDASQASASASRWLSPAGERQPEIEMSGPDGLAGTLERAVAQQFREWGDAQPAEVYEFFVRALERPLIARMLEFTRGNQLATAARLGLNRNTLRKKLKYLGLRKSRTS